MNIFQKATEKKQTGTKESKKLTFELKGKNVFNKMAKAVKLGRLIDNYKAQYTLITDELRSEAAGAYCTLYAQNEKNPESFVVKSEEVNGKSCQFMYIPTDSYKKIGEDEYNTLKDEIGEENLETTTTYSFNNAILEKYQDIIAAAISNITEIPDADKANLLEATTTYAVKKGTIDKLYEMASSKKGSTPKNEKIANLVETIRPTFQMKNLKEVDATAI